ncbi:putative MFS-type transporter YdeR [Psilocybe cubensis]|uniref:MFS-type transporter YdeR n=1 Tax=Psilocybe cubensis TaxID=181762 RepID=A0ACB8GX65_PSICU|nr:putative MFS-type transporter YdeR [Psilocybe cubensis]KAH9480118.1 putative MFS-type transporter YdeR [Psilocybe cubensis]
MSSNSTLNGDIEVASKEQEKPFHGSVLPTDLSDGPSKDFNFLPIPKRLRYHPAKPFNFNIWMNWGLSFAATFLISNMYYCQPLLIQMSITFGASYEAVSKVPTLIQAGYAVGLFFICPLGDLVRRRQLLLLLVFVTATLTIGLAITRSILVFQILNFLIGLANISPQILVPLAADLARPEQRAFAYSIVLTGMLSGVLIARVLSGVIAQFSSWRVVYYMAIGAQYLILLVSYAVIPDYPAKNKDMTYQGILWSMIKYSVTEPLVVQVEIMSIMTSACFSSYWVTLTFLLGGPPYNYSTLVIGLFGLLGLAGMAMGPFAGRIVDNIAPWYGMLVSTILLLVFQSIQTAAAGFSIAAVIIACIGLDAIRQMQNVSLTTAVFSIT